MPPAALKNTKYVGALSRKLDKIPVNQMHSKFQINFTSIFISIFIRPWVIRSVEKKFT